MIDYVLGKFRGAEREDAKLGIMEAADACEAWLDQEFVDVMNKYN